MQTAHPLSRSEIGVIVFSLGYVAAFTAWFLSIGDYEFIVYVATMIVLMALVAATRRMAAYPAALLWALSLWGLMHMAGGSVPVGGSVLYNMMLVPLTGTGELRILKYDQAVHAYGFAVTAWLVWHVLVHRHPSVRGTLSAYALPALASMGLGAMNEIVEFTAVMSVPETNVGGYFNTALDLVFNALGAVAAVLVIAAVERGRRGRRVR